MVLAKIVNNTNSAPTVLFTDKVNFSRYGIMNGNNNHIWSVANPHGNTVLTKLSRFMFGLVLSTISYYDYFFFLIDSSSI